MQRFSLSPQKTRFILGAAGIVAATFLLAGCGKTTTSSTGATSPTANNVIASPALGTPTAGQTEMTPVASPTMMKADTTTQAITNEGSQLNAVNKDATAIDQSLSDQPGTVN